jgi:hypothetical protein
MYESVGSYVAADSGQVAFSHFKRRRVARKLVRGSNAIRWRWWRDVERKWDGQNRVVLSHVDRSDVVVSIDQLEELRRR